jgi:hypothetical protein
VSSPKRSNQSNLEEIMKENKTRLCLEQLEKASYPRSCIMKNLIALLVVVLGLGIANVAEAKGGPGVHGGPGGHSGFGRPGVPARGAAHVYRGFYRANWANRTWNRTYGRFIYSHPSLPGSYYYSEPDKLYYPISMLEMP